MTQLVLGNSTGIKRYVRSNNVSFSALVSSDDGGSGYAVASGSAPDKIEILPAFRTAYEKARLNTNPLDIEPGAYTVILEPLAVADLLRYLSFGGFSGKGIQNQTSFLTGRLGSKVFDEKLTMIDDHTHEHTRTLPFDFRGLLAKRLRWSGRRGQSRSSRHGQRQEAGAVDWTLNEHAGLRRHSATFGRRARRKTLKEIIESAMTRCSSRVPLHEPSQSAGPGSAYPGWLFQGGERRIVAAQNMRFTEHVAGDE